MCYQISWQRRYRGDCLQVVPLHWRCAGMYYLQGCNYQQQQAEGHEVEGASVTRFVEGAARDADETVVIPAVQEGGAACCSVERVGLTGEGDQDIRQGQ